MIFPLKRTPLAIILAKDIDLASSPMVVGHKADGAVTVVSVEDPGHPDQGRVDFVFIGPDPVLRQWVVSDASGGSTTMIPVPYTHMTLPTDSSVSISVVAVSFKKKHTNIAVP